ncbi:unnamed protein product [Linum trigynum]|uniref:Uncharacterized protein n=1 Tax=Linum trigynum TaxID=586398 RepID=A0AAV2DBH2_9ROSI
MCGQKMANFFKYCPTSSIRDAPCVDLVNDNLCIPFHPYSLKPKVATPPDSSANMGFIRPLYVDNSANMGFIRPLCITPFAASTIPAASRKTIPPAAWDPSRTAPSKEHIIPPNESP